MFNELVADYARETADGLWARAVLAVAKYFHVSPRDVAAWDWELFLSALDVMREEAEAVKRAARRR